MSGVDLVMAAAVVLLSRRGSRSSQADFVHPFLFMSWYHWGVSLSSYH